jgi:hypothetical protein
MKVTGWNPRSLAAVFTQFWRPSSAYRLMEDTPGALTALVIAALVIVIAGAVPLVVLNWEELESRWSAERYGELSMDGYSGAEADSMLALELQEIRWRRGSIPFIGLAERIFYAVVGGLATFGAAYAAGIRGGVPAHLKSAALSQGAYILSALALALISLALSLPPEFTWSASSLFDTSVQNPSRLYVFGFVFASHLDLPSVVSVSLWGSGLAALMGRKSSFGLRMTWFVYTCGLLLVSTPALLSRTAA